MRERRCGLYSPHKKRPRQFPYKKLGHSPRKRPRRVPHKKYSPNKMPEQRFDPRKDTDLFIA
jgi:hypothetical protein